MFHWINIYLLTFKLPTYTERQNFRGTALSYLSRWSSFWTLYSRVYSTTERRVGAHLRDSSCRWESASSLDKRIRAMIVRILLIILAPTLSYRDSRPEVSEVCWRYLEKIVPLFSHAVPLWHNINISNISKSSTNLRILTRDVILQELRSNQIVCNDTDYAQLQELEVLKHARVLSRDWKYLLRSSIFTRVACM